MKKSTSYILMISLIIAMISFDLISKILFASYFDNGGSIISIIPDFFYFTYLKNTGAAYGIFGNATTGLTIFSVVFIAVFIVYDVRAHNQSVWYILGMSGIIGGAIGNLIDRLFLGYVRDFISIELFSFVFNLADLFITIGIVCFAIFLIRCVIEDNRKKDKVNDKVDDK